MVTFQVRHGFASFYLNFGVCGVVGLRSTAKPAAGVSVL